MIGVQSEAAPAAYRSWQEGVLVEDEMNTAAEGLPTRIGFELPVSIMRERLDDFVLVSEVEFREATAHMLERTRNLIEPARRSPARSCAEDGPWREEGRPDRQRWKHHDRSAACLLG